MNIIFIVSNVKSIAAGLSNYNKLASSLGAEYSGHREFKT